MASKELKSLSSIMIFTGNNSKLNAEALENRNYGYEDEFLGKLTKTTSGDSNWTYVSKEVFVETTPKWLKLNDLWENAYSYIISKSVEKPVSEMYLENIINFKYDWEKDLKRNAETNKTLPFNDINLALSSINNSLFNKQKYYSKNHELEYITYNGLKYTWQPIGTILNATYDGTQHPVGNGFVAYEFTTYMVQATEWNEATMTYVPKWNITKNEETGEEIKEPVMEAQYSLNYLDRLTDIVSAKLENITNNYIEKYGEFTPYYLYDLNNKISFIGNTYTFGKNSLDILLNYDGEFNHWFDNKISLTLNNLTPEKEILINVTPSEDKVLNEFNIVKDENEQIFGENVVNSSNTNIEFKLNSEESTLNLSILNPQAIDKLDLTNISENLSYEINVISDYDKKLNYIDSIKTNWVKEKGTKISELIVNSDSSKECNITNIYGLENLVELEKLNITNCKNLVNSPDLRNLNKLNTLLASGSNITSLELSKELENKVNVHLPNTIESIDLTNNECELILDSLNNLSSMNLVNSTIDKISISDIELNFEGEENKLDVSNKLIYTWLKQLKDSESLAVGKVNYINLENVNWSDTLYETLLMLKEVELKKLTGVVNIIRNDEISQLTRNEYRKLVDLYGVKVFENDNELKFNVNLANNAFGAKLSVSEKYVDIDEVEQERILGEYICEINDTVTGNSLLNYLTENEFVYNKFEDYINNNRINIGLTYTIDADLEMNEESEKIDTLTVGDILLYKKNQIIIVTKNIENINTKFIKLGKIKEAENFVNTILNLEETNLTLSCLEEQPI